MWQDALICLADIFCAWHVDADTHTRTHTHWYAQIDGDAAENQSPAQCADDAGAIEIDTLPLRSLPEALEEQEQAGFAVWVGLWAVAQGMRMQSLMPGVL